jgi:hypothetical protein
MTSLRSTSLMLAMLFAVASVGAAAAETPFIKQPKVMGSKISSVTGFQLRKPDNSGTTINCRGTCFSTGRTFHWQCTVQPNEIGHCSLHCSPPPARGECMIE